jgi:hypothetical protein
MATTPHAGAGTTFVFAGTTFTVTNITYSVNDVTGATEELDVSHLGQTTGATVLTMKKPLVGSAAGDTGKEVTMDYHGSVPVVGGSSGTLTITGGIAYTGVATRPSSSVTATVNEVMQGTATFKVA